MTSISYQDELTPVSSTVITCNAPFISDNFETDLSLQGVYVGDNVGRPSGGFGSNTFVGNNSANAFTSGNNNTAVGFNSATSLTSGSNNISVGSEVADTLNTGSDNIIIGYQAGSSGITTGNQNTIMGTRAGNGASSSLSGCVLIGYEAGLNNTTNNRLIIHNSSDLVTPLIDGNFSTPSITLNGVVNLGRNGGSDIANFNTTTALTATAGAQTLPANPAGFINVQVNGSGQKIPYYNL